MCGIAAYFGTSAFDSDYFLRALAHRGPDGRGAWSSAAADTAPRVHLAHARLAILDLSATGHQPMALRRLESGGWRTVFGADAHAADYAIAYNGEAYNFAVLRAELRTRGHEFASTGDTEVLLRGYAEWGGELFSRLDGMFALALYDRPRRRLVVARDHLGIKPLYYTRTRDGGLLFASQVRVLIGSGLCEREIDRAALLDYLRLGSYQEPATAFDGIWAFAPGCFGVVDLDEGSPGLLRCSPYWKITPETVAARERDWVAAHEARLRETVAEQLVADVPVGVFLSGGIDSTVLLELAAVAARDRLTAFTVGGELTAHDETKIAARTAANLGVKHVAVHLTRAEQEAWTADALRAMDQPSSDGINTYVVSRASRAAGLIAALGGTGADESHGAYGHGEKLARLIRLHRALGPCAGALEGIAARLLGWSRGPVARERLELMLGQAPSPWRVAQEKRRFFTPAEIAGFWPEGGAMPGRWQAPTDDEDALAKLPTQTQIMIAELRGYLANTLLRDSDWATMANAQELRVPYLGRRYIEFMLGMPSALKAPRGGQAKPLLAGLISTANRALLALPKKGFTLNYAALLLGPLRGEFHEACRWLNRELGFRLDADASLRTLAGAETSKRANRLWALLALGYFFSHS
jgi:asparagine synthase (glutamine-hydrolysing)